MCATLIPAGLELDAWHTLGRELALHPNGQADNLIIHMAALA